MQIGLFGVGVVFGFDCCCVFVEDWFSGCFSVWSSQWKRACFFAEEYFGLETSWPPLFLIVSKVNCLLSFAFILSRRRCFGFSYASGFFLRCFLVLTVVFCCRLAVFLDLGLKGSGASEAFGAREQRGQGVRQTWAGTDFGNAAPANFGIFLMNVSSRSALFRFDRLDF